MRKLALLGLSATFVVLSHASYAAGLNIDNQFTNLDFDASTQEQFPDGFDSATYDIPGWQDYGTITDSGIENVGWWNPYDQYAAFLKGGEGAYNLSSYVIQSGDVFDVSLYAKRWNFGESPDVEITLFYGSDASTNVIGSFNTGVLTNTDHSGWTLFEDATIAATAGSVGQTLGVRVVGQGTGYTNFDEVSISVIPEPATTAIVTGLIGLGALFIRRRRS